jgi:hypothetical protein
MAVESYSLRLINNKPAYVGIAEDGASGVLVAKFTRDQTQWHGYPYLHTGPKRDVPRPILDGWMAAGLIRKPIYRRLLSKQPC